MGPSELLFRSWVENTSSVVFSVLVRTGRDALISSMDSCFGCSLTLEFLLEGIFHGLDGISRFTWIYLRTLGYFPTQNDRTTIWGVLFRGYLCKGSFATGILGEVLHPVANHLEEMTKVYSKPIYKFV